MLTNYTLLNFKQDVKQCLYVMQNWEWKWWTQNSCVEKRGWWFQDRNMYTRKL